MLSYSANALLKTFEEPPSYAVIILLSSAPESLLPTVLSRCRTIYFQAIPEDEIREYLQTRFLSEEKNAKKFAALAQGSLKTAIDLAENGHAKRNSVLDILSKRDLKTYKSMTTVAATFVERIEESNKQIEQEAKEEFQKFPIENFSVYQQQMMEKELEGIITMSRMREAHFLFDNILSWYRDVHLLLNGGDSRFLMNPDYLPQLIQETERGDAISLDRVLKVVDEARNALQRSMSLQVCLESLFLKLDLIEKATP